MKAWCVPDLFSPLGQRIYGRRAVAAVACHAITISLTQWHRPCTGCLPVVLIMQPPSHLWGCCVDARTHPRPRLLRH
jgi:hypothetical protein